MVRDPLSAPNSGIYAAVVRLPMDRRLKYTYYCTGTVMACQIEGSKGQGSCVGIRLLTILQLFFKPLADLQICTAGLDAEKDLRPLLLHFPLMFVQDIYGSPRDAGEYFTAQEANKHRRLRQQTLSMSEMDCPAEAEAQAPASAPAQTPPQCCSSNQPQVLLFLCHSSPFHITLQKNCA